MKRVLLPIFIILILPPIAKAESITTGNASAKSEVKTSVSGGGSVYTKIEVEANGEKKILETNESGTHSLEVGTGSSKASSEVKAETTIKEDATKSAKIECVKNVAEKEKISGIEKMLKDISNWLKKFFSIF